MAASTTYQHALNKRRQLVGQLVEHYVDTKPGEENYELATDFCLGHLAYHSFPDTYPPAVDQYYAELLYRMRQESQLSKAAALEALCHQLHRRLAGCPGHLSHTLLQLLGALAGRPVGTPFQETPELLQLLYQPLGPSAAGGAGGSSARATWKHPAAAGRGSPVKGEALTDGSQTWSDTSGDEYDPYGDSSELSDWGDGDVAEDSGGAAADADHALVAAPSTTTTAAAAAGISRLAISTPRGSAAAAAFGHGRHAPHYVPAAGLLPTPVALRSTDLLARLVAVRSRHVLQLRPDPAYCFPERFYVQQALQVLQGKPAAGFDWCVDSRRFCVDRRCSTPRLSMGLLHGVMEQVAAAGTCARLLQQLADRLATAPLFGEQANSCNSSSGSSSGVRGSLVTSAAEVTTTPCLRAFGTALQQQLLLMATQLADLRAELTAEEEQAAAGGDASGGCSAGFPASATPSSSSSSSSKAPRTLVQLLRVTQGTRARVTLLQQVLPPLLQDMAPACPAAASTQLLNGLVELLEGGTGLSGAAGLGVQGCLLHLLLSSMVPLVDGLQRWLVGGREQEQLQPASTALNSSGVAAACCGHDFFIVQQGEVSVYDAKFWSHAYGFAPAPVVAAAAADGSGGLEQRRLPTCPAFLAPLAKEVLTAGKSLRLLRHMQQEECLTRYALQNSSTGSSGSSGEGGGLDAGPRQRSSRALAGLARPVVYTPLYTNGSTTSSSSSSGAAGGAYNRSSSISGSVRQGGAAGITRGTSIATRVSANGLGVASMGLTLPAAVAASRDVGGEADGSTSSQGRARQKWQVADRSSSDPRQVGKVLSQELQLQLALAAAAATRQDGQQLQRVFLATAVRVLQQGASPGAAAQGAGAGGATNSVHDGTAAAGGSGGGDLAAAAPQQPRQSAPVAQEVKRRLQQQMEAAGVAGSYPCSSLPPPQEQPSAAVLGPEEEEDGRKPWWEEEEQEEEESPVPAAGPTEEELEAAATLAEHSRATAAGGSMLAGLVDMQDQLLLPPDTAQQQQRAGLLAATSSSVGYLQQLQGILGGREGPGQQLEWLLHQPLGRWVPVQPLLQQALLAPIQQQVSSISRQLLGSLLGEWGLRQQLAALRNLYCLTSPTVVAWADVLLDRAASAARSGGLAAVDLSEMEALLGDMIVAAAGWEDLPDPSLLSLSLQSTSSGGGSTSSSRPGTAGTGAATAGGAQVAVGSSSSAGEAAAALVADVAGLAVHHGSSWLLSLVLDSAQLQQLNKALGFLLQLRATRRALDAARLAAFKAALPPEEEEEAAAAEAAAAAAAAAAGGTAAGHPLRGSAGRLAPALLSPHQEGVLLWEMAQLVARLQEYVGTQLVTGAWARLEQALRTAATLDDVCAATAGWLGDVLRQCCCGSPRGPGATWRHIGKQLQQLMGAAAAAAALHEQLQAARLAAARGGWGGGGSDSGSVASSRLTSLTSATRSSAAPHLAPGMAHILELRGGLAKQAAVWREGAGYLMRLLANKALQLGGGGDVEGLLAALDMNGYYSRASGA